MKRERLAIEGMSCTGCVRSVEMALEQAGVKNAAVEVGAALITYDESNTSHDRIVETIQEAGFEVKATLPAA